MLDKLKALVASITEKANKQVCLLIGLIAGYVAHPIVSPLVHIVTDIALIPLRIIGLI